MRVAKGAVAAVVIMLAPSSALASGGLPPGVHVDPGSPSQHQYVLPVNAARAETGGGGHGGPGSGGQLFGNGVQPGSSGGSSSASGALGGPAGQAANARALNGQPGAKGLHSSYTLASSGHPGSGSSSSDGGGSSWVPLAAGGAAVLLLGCGGGFALRRRIIRA